MATNMHGGRGSATASSTEILDGLNDLLQLNHDAIGAYNIAIEKLENREYATQISGFRLDHERHIRELNALIERLGGTPVNEPHATGPFKEAMQNLGAMAGDTGALLSWRVNELQVRTKYDNYAAEAVHWPDEVKRIIDQQALDEERHYRWVADLLQRMGIGAGEGPETHLANRMREQMGQMGAKAQEMSGRARQKMGEAADTARTKAADGLDRAAERLDRMADERAASGGRAARAAGAAHRVADGMESTAEYLRHPPRPEMLRSDLEGRVREQPLRTLVLLFGIGFVLGRILR